MAYRTTTQKIRCTASALRMHYTLLLLAVLSLPSVARAAPVPPIAIATPVFPLTTVGNSVTRNLTITVNSGGNSVVFKSITLAPGFSDFTLGTMTGCVADSATAYTDGTVCTLPVTFTPRFPGNASAAVPIARSAPLLINDVENGTAAQHAIGLTGGGTLPMPVLVPGIITDLVGNDLAPLNDQPPRTGFAGDGGPANTALFYQPMGIAVDAAGNIYISDTGNCVVRRVDKATQIINTVAGIGQSCGAGTDNVAATASMLNNNTGIALDTAGNLYIADAGNAAVRMVSAATGLITTVAGTLNSPGSTMFNQPATAAQFGNPNYIAVDGNGNLYIADSVDQTVSKVQAGTGTLAFIAEPILAQSIAVDSSGNMYVGDQNNGRLERIDAVTYAVTTMIQLESIPTSIALDASDTINYTAASDCNIYKLPAGATTPIQEADYGGCLVGNFTGLGDNGIATLAGLNLPNGLVVDGTGSIYVLEAEGVRFIDSTGTQATPIDFGAVALSGLSEQKVYLFDDDVLTLPAATPNPLNVSFSGVTTPFSISKLGGNQSCQQGTPTSPFAVDPGSYCTLNMDFTPIALGGVAATATLTEKPAATQLTQTLNLTGTGGSAEVTLTPGEIDLLDSVGDTSRPQTITLSNNRADSISITTIDFLGNVLGDLVQTNNCPVLLPGNSSCSITVTYTPTTDGTEANSVFEVYYKLNPGHGDYMEFLDSDTIGEGFNGGGSFGSGASGLTFGSETVNTTSQPQTLTLTSIGAPPTYTWGLVVNSLTISGPDAAQFLITGNTCGVPSIPVNSSCTISVAFAPIAPSSAGGFNATLNVAYNSGNTTPLSVPLTGIGVAGTLVLNIPETLHLDDAPVLRPALQLNVPEVLNLSDTPVERVAIQLPVFETLQLTDAAISAPETPGFTLTANPSIITVTKGFSASTLITLTPKFGYQGTATLNCTGLPPGATCTFVPATLVADGSDTPVTTTLTIHTLAAAAKPGTSAAIFWIPGAMLALLCGLNRKRMPKRLQQLLMLALLTTAVLGTSSCGGNSDNSTPTGTTTASVVVSMTATPSTTSVNLQQSLSITITVNP